MKKYVEFYFSELISDIYKGKAYRKSDIKNGETCDGKVLNYVTRTDLHNGIDTLIYNKTFSGIERQCHYQLGIRHPLFFINLLSLYVEII